MAKAGMNKFLRRGLNKFSIRWKKLKTSEVLINFFEILVLINSLLALAVDHCNYWFLLIPANYESYQPVQLAVVLLLAAHIPSVIILITGSLNVNRIVSIFFSLQF